MRIILVQSLGFVVTHVLYVSIFLGTVYTRSHIGNSTALFLMIGLMMPCFLFAMFEKDGLPFEKVLRNIIRTKFLLPRVRPYKTENFYAILNRKEEPPIADQHRGKSGRRKQKAS